MTSLAKFRTINGREKIRRRSFCFCEPSFAAIAGESNTWKFVYTPSIDLPRQILDLRPALQQETGRVADPGVEP